MGCRNSNLQVGCYTDPVTQIKTPVLIHSVDDFAGKPQLHIIDVAGDIVVGANETNTVAGECDCSPIQFATLKTQTSLVFPTGLKSITVRNKGAGSVYVAGKEVCPPTTAPSTPCGNCAGESLTLDAGCAVYGQPINVNIPAGGCAEIYLEWSHNPILDMTDSDGDGVPDWLEALNPCLALPEPDVTVSDLAGNPVGRAYSFSSPCFDMPIMDLASNVSYYAASAPTLNKAYVARTDFADNVTHYLLAL